MRRARARRICCITAPHYPILETIQTVYHFFSKKTSQSANYNKNGCKFAKRVNTTEYYILY